ncbi:CU044_5270 family protein [Nonomuraea sp. NPDC050783]|uniref:CU044_5270 family protein n=1 Tax=Nonomuraea sp. NPDC050783 TaxID=3154634 RepID=UPI003466FF2A
MNDLDEIAALLAKPQPSAAAAERSRAHLLRRARGAGHGRRRWFVPGAALVATAAATAAAAVVIATGTSSGDGAPVAGGRITGKDVLLMAAASAERAPQDSGTYWHVTIRYQPADIPPIESWTRRDGKRWTRNEPQDPPAAVVATRNTLRLKGAEVSFEELEKLPTEPEALKAWLVEREGVESGMLESEKRGDPTYSLIALITELPAPAEVRAAAFEALAATPGVENEGPVEGGQHLRLPGPGDNGRPIELVVDPAAARVTRANLVLGADGGSAMSNGYISVETEWTDRLPR